MALAASGGCCKEGVMKLLALRWSPRKASVVIASCAVLAFSAWISAPAFGQHGGGGHAGGGGHFGGGGHVYSAVCAGSVKPACGDNTCHDRGTTGWNAQLCGDPSGCASDTETGMNRPVVGSHVMMPPVLPEQKWSADGGDRAAYGYWIIRLTLAIQFRCIFRR